MTSIQTSLKPAAATGRVPGLVPAGAGPEVSADDDVITLVPMLDGRTGQVVYASPDDKHHEQHADQRHDQHDGLHQGPHRFVSTLPRDVMAGSAWDEVRQAMRQHERNERTSSVPAMLPGGQIVVHDQRSHTDQPIAVIPRDVMAATTVMPLTERDITDIEGLDPDNLEGWTPVYGQHVSGFMFTLSADPFPQLPPFVFFAFRSADDAGLWRVAVLSPNMDTAFGHTAHIVRTRVGSAQRAVLCGPGGRACRTLAEAREHAGKWKVYTAARMAGFDPGFSL